MADYIVSSWDEFLQHNTSGDTVKFANPHEVNGEIVLSGTGTQADPYIVSTYEEMLFATGATYIWKVKLIDREQKIYRYRYISDYDEQRNPIYSEIFCKYDDSLSTIDFNQIQPEGFSSALTFFANPIDFNGWTFENLIIKYELRFSYSGNEKRYKNCIFKNLIINAKRSTVIVNGFPNSVSNCIFDVTYIDCNSAAGNFTYAFNSIPSNSAITIHCHDNTNLFLASSDYYYTENTHITLDITSNWQMKSCALSNCVVDGILNPKNVYQNEKYLGGVVRNTVFNFESDFAFSDSYYNPNGVAILNKTKAPNVISDKANFKLVTDEVMRSAQDLADLGLPIGVD